MGEKIITNPKTRISNNICLLLNLTNLNYDINPKKLQIY